MTSWTASGQWNAVNNNVGSRFAVNDDVGSRVSTQKRAEQRGTWEVANK